MLDTATSAPAVTGRLTWLQLPAIGLWLIAGLLMAIAAIRARALPVAVGLGFAAGLPAAMALGRSGPLALAVLWGAVAAALAARRRRLPGNSPTPAAAA